MRGRARFASARVADGRRERWIGLSIFPHKEAILFRLQLDEWRQTAALLTDVLDASQRAPLERLRTATASY
jgi:hypothetical protein